MDLNEPTKAPDWSAIRQDFPTTQDFAYFDIANKTILPLQVEDAMQEWMRDIYEHAGARAYSMACIEETRQTVADTFGAAPDNLSLIKNTSEGINIVAQGFPWRDGDNVVISVFEHQNNIFPWRHLKDRGVEVRLAEPDVDGRITIDEYRGLVDERTRILSVSWVSFGNGYRADIPKLADFCRDRGVKLVVDGIQAVGALATPIADLGADVFIAGGHKSQFSVTGAGFMVTNDEMLGMLMPSYAAKNTFASGDRLDISLELATDGHRFEYGNYNYLGCWVQKRAAEYIATLGLIHIETRIRDLTTTLMEQADRCQIKVRTPRPWSERAGIVSLDLGCHAGETVARLKTQNIITSEKDGHLRVALHIYNSEEDLERLLEAVQAG